MKRWLAYLGALAILSGSNTLLAASKSDEEDNLIRVLQSNASPAEKDAACARLKFIGTARAVPALSTLLTDDQLSHSARYALEAMHLADAETALLGSLNKTRGLTKIGIINSLGVRGEPRAVPALSALARSSDTPFAFAAARALGQIDDPAAMKSLQDLAGHSTGAVHLAAVDGLLSGANRLLASGKSAQALPLFEMIYNAPEPEQVRVGAFRGMIIASGNDGLSQMVKAIEGPPSPEQSAALQLVRDVQAPNATRELGRLLPKVGMPVQIALVEGLEQRGDPAAAGDLVALMGNAMPEVRPSIISALGSLGDASVVPMLAGFATSGNAAEQSAARQALNNLNRGDVTEALVNQLANETSGVQAEVTRALGNRGDRAAVPRLFELAQQTNNTVRIAALQALAQLAQPDDLGPLVQLVLSAKDPPARVEAADAVNTAYQRLAGSGREVPVAPLVTGLKTGSPEARAALLPACSSLTQPDVRVALRTGLEDPNPQVREAAVRALCDTVDRELLDDLVNVARTTKEENFRSLAISAGVRVATQEEGIKISREQQITVLKALLQVATSPAQKRVVLAGLSETPVLEALNLVDPLVDDPGVHNEAARAAIKIGTALPSMQAQEALAVLNKALGAAGDDQTRQALQAAISKIEASADYITDWQVAGPYREAGKDYQALFDVVFPAEVGEGADVVWKPLPAATDTARPWVMDLLKALGGCEQCAAYARTWIHSDQDVAARLELGSDDGMKVWLNDKQVYALNTARPLTPGSDKVDVNLHSGWNRLMLKITQNNLGWEFCARFVKPDGSHLPGLQTGAAPKP
jgi:HEAT repeat protein